MEKIENISKEAEEWRPVVDHPGYEVSNWGRVRSIDRMVNHRNGVGVMSKGQLVSLSMRSGYYCVRFNLKGKQVFRCLHKILAKAFIPNPDNKKEVNHIDGIKMNNGLENLEWCTRLENQQHAIRAGLWKPFNKEFMSTENIEILTKESGRLLKSLNNGVVNVPALISFLREVEKLSSPSSRKSRKNRVDNHLNKFDLK